MPNFDMEEKPGNFMLLVAAMVLVILSVFGAIVTQTSKSPSVANAAPAPTPQVASVAASQPKAAPTKPAIARRQPGDGLNTYVVRTYWRSSPYQRVGEYEDENGKLHYFAFLKGKPGDRIFRIEKQPVLYSGNDDPRIMPLWVSTPKGVNYFQESAKRVRLGAIIVIDDLNTSGGTLSYAEYGIYLRGEFVETYSPKSAYRREFNDPYVPDKTGILVKYPNDDTTQVPHRYETILPREEPGLVLRNYWKSPPYMRVAEYEGNDGKLYYAAFMKGKAGDQILGDGNQMRFRSGDNPPSELPFSVPLPSKRNYYQQPVSRIRVNAIFITDRFTVKDGINRFRNFGRFTSSFEAQDGYKESFDQPWLSD